MQKNSIKNRKESLIEKWGGMINVDLYITDLLTTEILTVVGVDYHLKIKRSLLQLRINSIRKFTDTLQNMTEV